MSDLLDVLHTMFEDDQVVSTQEALEVKENVRTRLYTELYGRKAYTWVTAKTDSHSQMQTASGDSAYTAGFMDERPQDMTDPSSPSPMKPVHYKYIPPTPMEATAPIPVKGLREAPLG
jgi:hypothetical protein